MENHIYVVQENDTLYRIAKKFNTTITQLIERNNLHNTLLHVGQKLFISSPIEEKEKGHDSYQNFLIQNQGKGYLKIHTLLGNSYIPIFNVKIEVYQFFQQEKIIFFTGYTKDNGQIDNIILPTQLRRTDYLNGASYYKITASHEDYKEITIEEISIYDGIKSIQKIEMFPKDKKGQESYGN